MSKERPNKQEALENIFKADSGFTVPDESKKEVIVSVSKNEKTKKDFEFEIEKSIKKISVLKGQIENINSAIFNLKEGLKRFDKTSYDYLNSEELISRKTKEREDLEKDKEDLKNKLRLLGVFVHRNPFETDPAKKDVAFLDERDKN